MKQQTYGTSPVTVLGEKLNRQGAFQIVSQNIIGSEQLEIDNS